MSKSESLSRTGFLISILTVKGCFIKRLGKPVLY